MNNKQPGSRILTVSRHRFLLEVAITTKQHKKGLGGRQSMPADRGMLFVLKPAKQARVWMKDTHFALDVLWLDADKKIIHIESAIAPDSYPTLFGPEQPAHYVIELSAGQADKAGLRVGQQLVF